MARPSGRDIRTEALDETTHLIRSRGVTGFSVGDLATLVGVRAPSIHHHFARKDDLIAETVRRYRREFGDEVALIDAADPVERLRQHAELFLRAAHDDVLCLCGAAVAAWGDLSESARSEVRRFFDDQLVWVEDQFRTARGAGLLRSTVDPHRAATAHVAALEGALLLARAGIDTSAARAVPETLLEGVIT